MKLLSRFAIAAIVGFSVSSLIASASRSLGLWRGDVIFLLTVVRYSCILAVPLGVAFKAAMVSGCRPQPTGVHSVAMMNVGGRIVVECVPDQEVSGSSPIVPVDSRFPFSSE